MRIPTRRPFWRYFVCIWPLKRNKLFSACSGCDCEHTEMRLWSARVPKGLKRRANNTFLWRCNNDKLGYWQLSTVPKRKLKSCIAAFSSRCTDVKRRSKREEAVQLNHSRCFQWLTWSDGLCGFIYSSNLYAILNKFNCRNFPHYKVETCGNICAIPHRKSGPG